MEYFTQAIGEFGEDEFNRVTFHSCITYLMDIDSESLNMSEEEFYKRVEEND